MVRKKGDTITADYVNDLLQENALLKGLLKKHLYLADNIKIAEWQKLAARTRKALGIKGEG